MKKLILASLAAAVTLVSCTQESVVDPSITAAASTKTISYSPYAGASSTRGSAVNSNSDFCGTEGSYGSFKVSAYNETDQYFDFDQITYGGSSWAGTTTRYWPAEDATFHFGAYYPAGATFSTDPAFSYASDANSLTFGYTVAEAVADHEDIMYAITDVTYDASEDPVAVNLHFKHALTQIAFTATKDDDLAVTVNSVTICNVVDNGTFKATATTTDSNVSGGTTANASVTTSNAGSWTPATAAANSSTNTANESENIQHYAAAMSYDNDESYTTVTKSTVVALSDATDVLMLLPQKLTAWSDSKTYTASGSNDGVAYGTDSYLAIVCTIADSTGAVIVDEGTVYVPFDSAVNYNGDEDTTDTGEDSWQAGYKLTYNLHFGGGYSGPGGTTPEPGEVPDPDDAVLTLRTITYTVTVDEWKTPSSDSDVSL